MEKSEGKTVLKKRKANIDLAQFYKENEGEQLQDKRYKVDCPYLGQIKRHLLDFDFEKLCSVSLSNLNVYSCLVCGKYFQGKGKQTHAYIHSLEDSHNIFINLGDQKIYCLPDNYEIVDASLNDIKYNLNPVYNQLLVEQLDKEPLYARGLDGTEFLPGCLGLNNLKETDFVNVVVQSICRIKPLRDHFLLDKKILEEENKSLKEEKKEGGIVHSVDPKLLLLVRFGELIRKIWNPKNFKGHVSPHELLQAVSQASQKRFRIGEQKDPIQFVSWFFNTLSQSCEEQLGKRGKKKEHKNIIEETFQGELELTQLTPKTSDINFLNKIQAMKTNADVSVQYDMQNKNVKFFFLTLEIPAIPLFKEQSQLTSLPQIPLQQLMKKFDGNSFQEEAVTCVKRKYKISRLPRYLIIHMKRFTKNEFFIEKNQTIVNFPIKGLDLSEYVWGEEGRSPQKYDLLANIIHDGKPEYGSYRVQVRHKPTDEWLDIQDLHVNKIMPQQVLVSESYILIFEKQLE